MVVAVAELHYILPGVAAMGAHLKRERTAAGGASLLIRVYSFLNELLLESY